MKPRLYSQAMQLQGVLINASGVSFRRVHNNLFTARFQLPYHDSMNALCDTHSVVDIFDGNVSRGKYRILDEPETDVSEDGAIVEYSCEHVIAFLLNDVIDGYLETGGTGVTTRQVLEQLLAMQTVQRWQLGQCDFNYEFQYSWENTNLLDAFFSVPKCFADEYHWTYDTTTYPWTVNLLAQSSSRSCEIRRGRNMQQIKREKVGSALCNRLYCKGYGEGINQLTIKDVNNGLPYIQDATSIARYGMLAGHYIDTTITDAETLLAKGQSLLETTKNPKYVYKVKAVDFFKLTGSSWDDCDEGKAVHVIDVERGIELDALIVEIAKNDVDGNPLDMDISISNLTSDTATSLEDLARRTAITAQYSQGATNLYSQQFADNCDDTHPAVMSIYIPESCVRINQVLLSWDCEKFRAYSKSASSGGASSVTSASGGGFYGETGYYGRTGWANESSSFPTDSSGAHTHTVTGSGTVDYVPDTVDISGSTNETGSHTHGVDITEHTHNILALEFDPHTHTVQLPDHTHGIVYGIYEGTKATSCSLSVDGVTVQTGVTDGSNIDIVQYLSKDSAGKIKRNTWHKIEIIPDRMSRIEANLFVKTFITSFSGGNY